MQKEIIISLNDKDDSIKWSIPFNSVKPASLGSPCLYLRNIGEYPVTLDCISISSNKRNSTIQIHSVLGEPVFTRENDLKPVNKNLWRNGLLPDIEVKSADHIAEVYSQGQLDRLDFKEENTTYKVKCDIVIPTDSVVAVTAGTEGTLSGIITISQENIDEE